MEKEKIKKIFKYLTKNDNLEVIMIIGGILLTIILYLIYILFN